MTKHWTILTIRDGQIQNPNAVKKLFDQLKDGKHRIDAFPLNQRSIPQNKFYWGLVVPMIQKGILDLGTELTKEETHEFLKARFNAQELVNQETGECVSIPRSTTALSKEAFSSYIEKIQQFGAEFLSIVIPDPNTQMALNYD